MYRILLSAHSGIRYLAVALLVVVLVKSLKGWINREPFHNLDDKLSLFLMISVHLQLVLGLALYFVSPKVRFESGVMADAMSRYWTVEHILLNLIAIVLITLGRTKSKRLTLPEYKHRTLFLFTVVGALLVVMALSMPQAPGLFGAY